MYEATTVEPVLLLDDDGRTVDSRVLIGVGWDDAFPTAYVAICPTEGVEGLIQDLREAAAAAAEHHAEHALHTARVEARR